MKKLFTLFALCAIFLSVKAQKEVTLPYHENFESAQCENTWHTYNENGDDGEWLYADITWGGVGYQSSSCFMYIYSYMNAGNDWLVSPGFSLQAGTSYAISFKYAEFDSTKTEKLKVYIGTDSLPSGFSNSIIDIPSISNATYITSDYDFTPNSSGTYYIGFQTYSDVNQGALLIDEFNISTEASINDELNIFENVKVFPNPATNIITVKNASASLISIIDARGQLILSEELSNNEYSIDLSSIKSGIYFLQLNNNGIIKTQKLIVK